MTSDEPAIGDAATDQRNAIFAHGDWEIDLSRRELRWRGERLALGRRAFAILEVLLGRAGEAVSRAVLTQVAWPGISVEDNTLDVHMLSLRRAFGHEPGLLRTLRGRGYQLLGEWRQRAAAEAPDAGNLPPPGDVLVGRQLALRTVTGLLHAHRLVTLTGSAGIGKTRLAIEAARHAADEAGISAFLVDLTTATESQHVPRAVAEALLPGGDPDHWTSGQLAEALANRTALLLLDGCEHVAGCTAEVAQAVVKRCAGIRILVTGRDTLRIDGEQVWHVPPLEPPPADQASPARPVAYAAVALFLHRMQQAGAPPIDDAEDLGRIGEICRRLDGLPLAIEWAAFRAAGLGIDAVLSGLPARLLSLGSNQRTAPSRHRTLRATLDWSSDRLTQGERRLMRRLGVFAGPFTLDAALAIAGEDLNDDEIIDGIASLVEQSILLSDADAGERCWRMLETTRAYALEQLAAAGEEASTAARLAEHDRDMGKLPAQPRRRFQK